MSRGKLVLVPARPEYAAEYLAWRKEPKLVAYNPQMQLDLPSLAARLARAGNDLKQQTFEEYRWFLRLEGELAGTVALKNVNWVMGHGEIGYHLAEKFHGKGLGEEGAGLLVEKVFREAPELVRLCAVVSVENFASRRVVEKLGFKLEGTLRQHVVIGGRRVDQWMFGLMRDEWIR